MMSSLPEFANDFLFIRTKSGLIKPFSFNRSQLYLHSRLENQLKETGKVRAIILKGRQGGCSTYVQARDFQKVTTEEGKRAFILTHEAEATKNIFNITKTYYDRIVPGLIPTADTSSAKELNFKSLGSGYAVATAGNKGAGRSQTIQLFHGSEVAYWPNAEEHATGALQAVSNEPGTEVILESTANGIGGYYYNLWQAAISGESDYEAIFIPWYWQTEYTCEPRKNDTLTLTDEEQEYMAYHAENGLTKEHLYWRRRKLKEFSNNYESSVERFNTEYPMTALDAFRNPIENRFINANLVMTARKNNVESASPLVIGVDPAYGSTDRLAIIRRKGRLAYNIETHHNMNSMEIVGLIRRIIDKEHPSKVCIDAIGAGGIIDRLLEIGYACVEGVNVARRANGCDKFKNLRAELWHDMREWLAQDTPVQIPDSDELMGDLTSLGYKYDSSGRLQIESKDDLKARGMKSPDIADALALTFAVGDYLHAEFTANRIDERAAGMFI